jgi:arginyl-tRNA synthetase
MHSSLLTKSLSDFLSQSSKEGSADIFQITLPPERKFGDICINIFPAVKATKTPPPQLAEELLNFMKSEDYITDGNIQGGFVNLFVTDKFYMEELSTWSLPSFEKKNQTIIVDYNQPNIGKPLHIGHLCTPLFGQATINLLRTMWFEVIGDMHQGDWGGIFGKLITGWKYFGDEDAFEKDPVNHLLQIYIAITAKIEKEENVDQECRDAFKLLSEGDEDSVKLWQRFTDKSLAGVRNVMSEFGVHPDMWIGESFYEWLPLPKLGNWPDLTPDNTMSSVVDELIESWIATKNEDQSVGVVFEKETKIPSCILQKKDGTHGYLASDLAAVKYRMKNWNPARILYFVDNRQALHFRQVFATAKAAWFNVEHGTLNIELTHAANGFVALPDGAMSTRHGRVIFLHDLIDESFDRVKKILLEREHTLADDDIKSVALGAIIYSFLCQDRERDWIFEWDKVLAFEGSSGPYLQYTYVRWKKVLSDVPEHWTLNIEHWTLTVFDRDLIMDILSFNEVLIATWTSYKFHLIVAHITTMARHLNALYVNTPKMKDTPEAERATRAHVVDTCLEIIEYTTKILGIPLPSEM